MVLTSKAKSEGIRLMENPKTYSGPLYSKPGKQTEGRDPKARPPNTQCVLAQASPAGMRAKP